MSPPTKFDNPMVPELFLPRADILDKTEGGLQKLVEVIANEQNYDNFEANISRIYSTGAMTSKLYIITIKDKKKRDLHLFAKLAGVNETSRVLLPQDMYKTEFIFYTEIMKRYEQIQEDSGFSSHEKFIVPKFYGGNSMYLNEIIILENLIAHNYKTYNKIEHFDWNHTCKALETLAKFHALSIAYNKSYPEEFQNIIKNFTFKLANKELMEEVYMAVAFTHLEIINVENTKEKLRKYLTNVNVENFIAAHKPIRQAVLIHNDYKPENLLYKVGKDGTLKMAVLDFQIVVAGCLILDLLYFIFVVFDRQFRKNNFEQVLQFYYQELQSALRKLNINPVHVYSKEDFDYEFKKILPDLLVSLLIRLPLVFADTTGLLKDGELHIDPTITVKNNPFYRERINGIIDDFVEWGVI